MVQWVTFTKTWRCVSCKFASNIGSHTDLQHIKSGNIYDTFLATPPSFVIFLLGPWMNWFKGCEVDQMHQMHQIGSHTYTDLQLINSEYLYDTSLATPPSLVIFLLGRWMNWLKGCSSDNQLLAVRCIKCINASNALEADGYLPLLQCMQKLKKKKLRLATNTNTNINTNTNTNMNTLLPFMKGLFCFMMIWWSSTDLMEMTHCQDHILKENGQKFC